MISNTTFEEDLEFEKTLSEYKRVKLFSYILFTGFVLGVINIYFNLFGFLSFFKYTSSAYTTMIWMFFFLSYELIFLFMLNKYIINKKAIGESVKFFHSLIEILFPGILIFMMTYLEKRPVYLDSPYFFIYFILIAISALQLSFKISFSLGILAALQYAFLTYYSFRYIIPETGTTMTLPEVSYYVRCIMLLFTGIASGFIASEIRTRVKNSFSQMRDQQQIINLFGQQVSREIVDELLLRKDHLDVKKVNATIMFLDIRNFSTYAETKDPAEIIEFQNNIFDPLIEIISKHKGIVNQFLGDGFMASFGIPLETDKHEQNAYEAGLEIINKINVLGEMNIIPKTKVGIGLDSGEVITGNIGNDIRKQYSIAGTTVITSARLEQLNKQFQTQYLITRDFLNKIITNGQQVESLGEVPIKGYEKPVEVMCVRV